MASILEQTQASQVRRMELASDSSPEQKDELLNPLVAKIRNFLQEAETARQPWESQAINNIKSYRGQDIGKTRESEVSNVYIRTTTVKTRAAYSHIMESIMNNSRFPLMIEATPVPEGIADYASTMDGGPASGVPESQEDFGLGFEGDGKTMSPGATFDNMSFLEDENSDYNGANLKEGRDRTGQGAQIRPAVRAAERLNRVLQDQLEESNAHSELRKSVFEACLLGNGAMKGIFTEEKTNHRWVDGQYTPEKTVFPKVVHTSMWDLYVDPNAFCMDEAEWVIERHRFTAKNLRDLKNRAFFDKEKIDAAIVSGANYSEKSFEHTVRSDETTVNNGRLWEVLEYWGYLSAQEAEDAGMDVTGIETGDQVQVNMWVCGNQVLRLVLNPFLPQRLPYFVFDYEVNPYSFYGTGVPETMEDSQKQMNGFARLAVDNLALAGNMVFDVDESMLIPGQDMSLYPGKIFRRQGGQPGQAVHALKFNSTAQENMMMFSQMRQLADESTGIPSISHGQTGVTGVGRTSSGLSMILENASLNIKTVIRNIDDKLLQPLGTMLFYWNHQFNSDAIPQGDFDVIATGVRSYTKQEQRVQQLQTLMQLSANPAVAPLVRFPALIRDLVKSMDLNPDDYINDIEDAKIYAEIIGMAGGIQGGGGGPQGIPQAGPPGAMDPGFTGNDVGAGNMGGFNGDVAGTNAPVA